MNIPEHKSDFDSLAYWRARHDQYLTDSRGVGNLSFDTAENDRIYAAMDSYVGSIAEALKSKASPKVLDLGCGIGMITGAFIRSGYNYTGVDISETATQIARAKFPASRFEVANIAELPLQEAFDLIIERTVFIHLIEDEYWSKALAQVGRLLAPGGVFVLMDHLPPVDARSPAGATHVKLRGHDEYAEQFAQLGLGFDVALRELIAKRLPLSPNTHFVTHVR